VALPHPSFHDEVFRGTDVLRRGVLSRAQLRNPRWRRLRHDVYCDAGLPLTHELMTRAVALSAPADAVFGGMTAASWWSTRGPLAGPGDPVELVLPPTVRWNPGPGVVVRQATTSRDVVTDGRLHYTDRTRTALDLIRRGPVDEAIVLLDRLVYHRATFLEDVRAAAARLPRCRGSAQARRVAGLADGLAQSPPETRLRLLIHRSSLPIPVAQFEIRHQRRFVAQVDFAFPDQKLAIEYDGAYHGEPSQLTQDRARMNRLLAAGWRTLFVTAADMRNPEALIAQIAAALAA